MATTFNATDAAGYERLMGRWSRRLAPLLIDFAEPMPGDRVLDVGCGTGSLARALAARIEPAVIAGIDVAEPFVIYAKAQLDDPRIHLRVGDACALPYEDASFDLALSLLVLQFVPEPAAALREMRRVVRPGGTLAAAVWDGFGGMPHMRMLFDTAAALMPENQKARELFRPLHGPGEMGELWRSEGLLDVTETSLIIRMDFQDFDDYWTPFLTLNGPPGRMLAELSDEGIRSLREAVRRAYESNRPDGPRSFVALAWACRGRVP